MKIRRLSAVMGIAVALLLSTGRSAEDPAINQGVAYLQSQAALDGSLGKGVDIAGSALALLGLQALGEETAEALALLGGEEPGTAGETAYQLLATSDPGLAPDLLVFQLPDGSFGSIHLTALAALALARAGTPNAEAIGYLLEKLENLSSNEDLAVTALALQASGAPNALALERLAASQYPGGSFGDAMSTAWAILALRAYGGHGVELNAGVNALLAMENDEGGWGQPPHPGEESDVLTTGLAVWALAGSGADVSSAVSFLRSEQDASGLWTDEARAIKVTGTVVDALGHIQELPAVQAAGLAYLGTAKAANNEQEARRVASLLGGGANVGDAFDLFLSLQDPGTGSWPLAEGYGGDAVVTAWALETMTQAHFYDGTIQNRAVSYLKNKVNADGSWGYAGGGEGTVAATAEVMLGLEPYRKRFSLDGLLESAGGWIEGQQNSDGSFGPNGGSAWETALALLALYGTDFDGAVVTEGFERLKAMQNEDGGWGQPAPQGKSDAYATALALWAIYDAKPNLLVRDADVSFSNEDPTEGDVIKVRAKVTNTGGFPAEQVVVRFYNGDPSQGGPVIGEDTIASLARKEQAEVEITWNTAGVEGPLYVFVQVDPEDKIDESNEKDNLAVHDLLVSRRADLVVTDADLRTLPELSDLTQDSPIQIIARVTNAGGRDVTDYRSELRAVDPVSGDTVVLFWWQGQLYAGDAVELIATIYPYSGTHDYTIVLDTLDQVAEADETNNTAKITISMADRVDLALTNLIYSTQAPAESDQVTITALVYNSFYHEVPQVKVKFWLGDPNAGGTVLGEETIGLILPGQTGRASVIFDTTGHAGTNYIYAMVDPGNAIVEANEYNNLIKGALQVTSIPDVLIAGGDIYFNTEIWLELNVVTQVPYLEIMPSDPQVPQGGDLKVDLLLSNRGFSTAENVLVRFFLGNPEEGGVMLDLDTMVGFVLYRSGPQSGAWYSSATSQYTSIVTVHYNTLLLPVGNYDLWVVLDPEDTVHESNETNNRAHATFQVVERPDLVISESRINFSSAHPENGEKVTLSATVENISFSPAKDFHVLIFDGDPRITGTLIGETLTVPLYVDPNGWQYPWALWGTNPWPSSAFPRQMTLSVEWDTEKKLGWHDIFVQVDPEDEISEKSETNNLAYRRIQVVPATAPDLTIRSESLVFDPETAASGNPITVSATVENLRYFTAQEVVVRFFRSDPELGTVLVGDGQTVASLGGRESATVSAEFNTSEVVGRVVVSAVADPDDAIPESDETNNRGERAVVVKLPPEYLPSGLTVDVDLTTAFLNWIRAQYADVGHYVLRDGKIVNEQLMDVAKGASASASDFDGDTHQASAAVDGDYQTWWRKKDRQAGWMELDLGREYYLNTMVVSWLDRGIGREFRLSTWDGEKFVERLHVNGNEDRNSVHYFDQNLKTRRVRLAFVAQGSGGDEIGINEINLFAIKPVE